MTNERLAVDCLLAAKILHATGSFETGQSILRDAAARIRQMEVELAAARELIGLLEGEQARADAAEAALADLRHATRGQTFTFDEGREWKHRAERAEAALATARDDALALSRSPENIDAKSPPPPSK